jgi:hypothetical protein
MRIPKLQIAHLEKGLGEEAGRRREGGKEAEGDYWRRQWRRRHQLRRAVHCGLSEEPSVTGQRHPYPEASMHGNPATCPAPIGRSHVLIHKHRGTGTRQRVPLPLDEAASSGGPSTAAGSQSDAQFFSGDIDGASAQLGWFV